MLADIEDPAIRKFEIDPKLYYPADVYRTPSLVFPKDFKIEIDKMIKQKLGAKVEAKVEDVKGDIKETARALNRMRDDVAQHRRMHAIK